MTTRTSARHRKAARPLTPMTSVAPAARRGIAVAASSGLALTLLASGANAADSTPAANSAGALGASGVGAIAAKARTAVATNEEITTGSTEALADVSAVAEVSVEAPQPEVQAAPEPETTAAAESTSTTHSEATVTTVELPASAAGSTIAAIAAQYVGVPYVYGGTTPSGWDCSGFVQYVYAQAGISLPRTSYAQGAAGTLVSAAQAQPGDIVYYGGHVGIYVGNGMMIDAGTPATGTVYRAVYGTPIGYVRIG